VHLVVRTGAPNCEHACRVTGPRREEIVSLLLHPRRNNLDVPNENGVIEARRGNLMVALVKVKQDPDLLQR